MFDYSENFWELTTNHPSLGASMFFSREVSMRWSRILFGTSQGTQVNPFLVPCTKACSDGANSFLCSRPFSFTQFSLHSCHTCFGSVLYVFVYLYNCCRNACISASVDSEQAMGLLASFASESFQTDTISYNAAIATCEQDLSWPTVPSICLARDCFGTVFANVAIEKGHRYFPVMPPRPTGMSDYSSSKKWLASVSLK